MQEPIPIFENKFAGYVKQLDDDSKSISANLRMIAEGKARAGYFNEIVDKIANMQQTISALKYLEIRKEVIGVEVRNRLNRILNNAIEQAKAEANENPDDPFNLRKQI